MESKNQVDKMISEIDCFNKIKQSVEGEYPYRFNPLDAVYIDENAQSRILAKLMNYKCCNSSNTEEYLFAKELIKHLQKNKKFNFTGNIEDIEVTVEKYRIDILIRQKKDFAIIIENKVYNAVDQPNQIDRYINLCRNYLNFNDDSIYVIYLTPRKSSIPLGSFNEENRRKLKGRYISISVDNDLLEILDEFKRLIPKNEGLLSSGVDQYIDYLEYFMNSEKYNSEMNEKIAERLENHLELKHLDLVEKLERLSHLQQEISSFKNNVDSMYDDFRRNIIMYWYNQLSEKEDQLKEKYKLKLNKDLEVERKFVELIPDEHPEISFRIEDDSNSLYYGIHTHGEKEPSIQNKYEKDGFITNDPKWYTWKYINYNEYREGVSILIDYVMEFLPKNN